MTTKDTIAYKTPAEEPKYKGEVTAAQIEQWKTNNPRGIFGCISDDDKHIGYFREPYREDINTALVAQSVKRPLATIEKFHDLLWLGGSDDMKTDTAYWGGVSENLREKMNGIKARLVNL